jgi:ATP/maltotriose-dependent transcriptional regulator MalT
MRARAAARNGEGERFRELLSQAERLSDASEEEPSPWTSPFDEGSLAGEASRGLCDLGDYSASMAYAHRALELRSTERSRSRALARLVLATALIRRGEIDHACAQVQEVSATIGGIASHVVAQHFDTAVVSLRSFGSSRLVARTLPAMEATATQIRQQLHWPGPLGQGDRGGRGFF